VYKITEYANMGVQTQGFTVCVCARVRTCVCTCGKEGVFSLFMEFNTCCIDCGINICMYQQNPQQFDLVVMQWENNTTGSHSN